MNPLTESIEPQRDFSPHLFLPVLTGKCQRLNIRTISVTWVSISLHPIVYPGFMANKTSQKLPCLSRGLANSTLAPGLYTQNWRESHARIISIWLPGSRWPRNASLGWQGRQHLLTRRIVPARLLVADHLSRANVSLPSAKLSTCLPVFYSNISKHDSHKNSQQDSVRISRQAFGKMTDHVR